MGLETWRSRPQDIQHSQQILGLVFEDYLKTSRVANYTLFTNYFHPFEDELYSSSRLYTHSRCRMYGSYQDVQM